MNTETYLLNFQRTNVVPKNKKNSNPRYCPYQTGCPLEGNIPENGTAKIISITKIRNFFIFIVSGGKFPPLNSFTYGYPPTKSD